MRANGLPIIDEWYKAAFYDPSTGTYNGFGAGNAAAPTPVANGTSANTAVYNQLLAAGPADINDAGSVSPYGMMAASGNVYEWEESEQDMVNDDPAAQRSAPEVSGLTTVPSTSRRSHESIQVLTTRISASVFV